MKFIWQGAEAPSDVDTLYGAGVRDMGLSLSSFKRRVKSPQTNLDRFADDVRLYLYDSAAWDTEATQDDLLASAEHYERFLNQYYTKFHVFTEFDCPTLGKEWIFNRRDEFYDEDRFGDQYWVSWQPSYGLDHLKYLGESYTDVLIPVATLNDSRVLNIISSIRNEYQTQFHCNGFSLDRSNRHELFDSIFMSTWVSALKHSDLYVPQGNWIQRVPKGERDAHIVRHGDFIEGLGCDPKMLLDGNAQEHEMYTVRLFRNLETSYSSIVDVLSDSSQETTPISIHADQPEVSDSDHPSPVNSGLPMVADNYRESGHADYPIMAVQATPTLPNLEVEVRRSFQPDEEGRMVISDVPVMRRKAQTARVCDHCSLASVCPAHTQGASCKFHMPVQIRTREQLAALTEAMLELQAGRVFFASYGEEVSGYPDPAVGKELDRFMKLAKDAAKLGESKETLRIEARTSGQGVLSQLFGKPQ